MLINMNLNKGGNKPAKIKNKNYHIIILVSFSLQNYGVQPYFWLLM